MKVPTNGGSWGNSHLVRATLDAFPTGFGLNRCAMGGGYAVPTQLSNCHRIAGCLGENHDIEAEQIFCYQKSARI